MELAKRLVQIFVQRRLAHGHHHDLQLPNLGGVQTVNAMLQQILGLADNFFGGQVANKEIPRSTKPAAHGAAAHGRTTNNRTLFVRRIAVQNRLYRRVCIGEHVLGYVFSSIWKSLNRAPRRRNGRGWDKCGRIGCHSPIVPVIAIPPQTEMREIMPHESHSSRSYTQRD